MTLLTSHTMTTELTDVEYRPVSPSLVSPRHTPPPPHFPVPPSPPSEPMDDVSMTEDSMETKEDGLPAVHAAVSFALKRPNAPRGDHSPSPVLPPAREEDVQRAREKRNMTSGADEKGEGGAFATAMAKKKREPVERSRKEEMEAYGRTFEGCGKQSDYNITTKLGEGTFGYVVTFDCLVCSF